MSTSLNPAVARELAEHLRAVCARIGADASRHELIKYTINAVYRVPPYVIRMSADPDTAARTVTTAAALTAARAPTIRLADVGPQPVRAGPWAATVWELVETVGRAPEPVDLAAPVKAIHALPPLETGEEGLRTWEPIAKARRRIRRAAGAPWMDRWARAALGVSSHSLLAALNERCDAVASDLARIRWQLPTGLTHGDVHTGNLLLTSRGAILCDLDSVAIGPREWDLTPPAHGATRMGRSKTAYRAFADAYGFDVLDWDGWPTLKAVRDLQMATSVLGAFDGRDDVATQLAHRLRTLLAGDDTAIWTRYA